MTGVGETAVVVAVLAGNYEQAREHMRESDDGARMIYVGELKDARGYRFDGYVTVGTFWRREDAARLLNSLRFTVPGVTPREGKW